MADTKGNNTAKKGATKKFEQKKVAEKSAPVADESKTENLKETTVKAGENNNKEESISPDKKAAFIEMFKDPEILALMRDQFGGDANAPVYGGIAGDETVTTIHMHKNADGISTTINYGQGKTRSYYQYGESQDMSLREFEQEFAPSPVGKRLLDKKILIVGDNCPKSTRDRLGLNYEDGEFLTPNQVEGLLDLQADELCEIFEQLCLTQKHMVVKIIAEEYYNGGNRATRDKIGKLNKASKQFTDGQPGMLAAILEEMNATDSDL